MDIRLALYGHQELMARLRGAARKAPSVMRTSMRNSTQPFQRALRPAAPVKTGSTRRSVGNVSRRDGIMVGVRPNWVDPTTGKRPGIYAARVNRKKGDWFGQVWNQHRQEIPRRLFAALTNNLIKKGF